MKKSHLLFNIIAPIYGLFFKHQKKGFNQAILNTKEYLNLNLYKSIIDIGCGTGAFCSVINEMGIKIIGIDPAVKMIKYAKKKEKNLEFYVGDVLEGLPFNDKTFYISFASYVAHGLSKINRIKMYKEMNRITKEKIIFHDYNQKKSLKTSIIEWLEHGDYFNFIKYVKEEMQENFKDVTIINVAPNASWYICTPK